MKGLVKKDLFMIKSNLRIVILFLFVFTIMSVQNKSDLSFLPAFISVMLFMSTFSYDDFNNWNAYAITLPNGRVNIVKSKYIASLILAMLSIIVTVILMVAIAISNNTLDIEKIISSIMGCMLAIAFLQSVLYPLIFKYGVEKGRIVLFILVFIITIIIGILLKGIKIQSGIIDIFNDYWAIIIPLVSVITLFISYNISKKIYLKKEF